MRGEDRQRPELPGQVGVRALLHRLRDGLHVLRAFTGGKHLTSEHHGHHQRDERDDADDDDQDQVAAGQVHGRSLATGLRRQRCARTYVLLSSGARARSIDLVDGPTWPRRACRRCDLPHAALCRSLLTRGGPREADGMWDSPHFGRGRASREQGSARAARTCDSTVLPSSWVISKSSIRPRSSAHGSTPSMSLVGGVLRRDGAGGDRRRRGAGPRRRIRTSTGPSSAAVVLADQQGAGLADGEADLLDELLVLARRGGRRRRRPAGRCGRAPGPARWRR